eukprot:3904587-Amphidinium_carterae.1
MSEYFASGVSLQAPPCAAAQTELLRQGANQSVNTQSDTRKVRSAGTWDQIARKVCKRIVSGYFAPPLAPPLALTLMHSKGTDE